MECPICFDVDLQPSDDALVALSCSACGGDFLSADATRTLVSEHLQLKLELLPGLESFSRKEPLTCLECATELTRIQLKGVEVDWCSACGGCWLDGGELYHLSGRRWGTPAPRRLPTDFLSAPVKLSLEQLMAHSEYTLKQNVEMDLTSAPFTNDRAHYYDLLGPTGTVLRIVEEAGGVKQTLTSNLNQNQPHKLYVVNLDFDILLELSRPWTFLPVNMEVKLSELNQLIGKVEDTLNPIIRTWELSDQSERIFAKIRGPIWRPWSFFIEHPTTGARFGVIKKHWVGWFKETFTREDKFAISFGSHPWTLEQRCILLAATLSMNLPCFEKPNQ